MEKTLSMKTDSSITLNFLIYIQNIYLNQIQVDEELRFPFWSKKVMFKDDFEIEFRELWNEVSNMISSDGAIDLKIFYKNEDLFYQKLFEEGNSTSLQNYHEVYKSFQVWWNSFAGRFSLERSVDDMGQTIYYELVNFLSLNQKEAKRPLNISLLYDECVLADAELTSYFAILPIRDFFVRHKELASRLRGCFE